MNEKSSFKIHCNDNSNLSDEVPHLPVHLHPGPAAALPLIPLTHPEPVELDLLEDEVGGGQAHRLPGHATVCHHLAPGS